MATSTTSELDYRPSYRAALLVSLATLVLYLVTLAPSTAMWDTSEYIAAAYTLGLPHPPGNPLFVILGRVFSILPIASSVAVRINILAAICSAVSAGMWFLITERVLVSWFPQRWQRILGGVVAALLGATAFTVWNQSVVNEKVYTVSLVGIAIISWLMIRWSDDPDGRKADRTLVLVAYLLGLGYSNPYLSPYEEFQRYKTHPAIRGFPPQGPRSHRARVRVEARLLEKAPENLTLTLTFADSTLPPVTRRVSRGADRVAFGMGTIPAMLVTSLGLPKALRRNFVPAPDFARAFHEASAQPGACSRICREVSPSYSP